MRLQEEKKNIDGKMERLIARLRGRGQSDDEDE